RDVIADIASAVERPLQRFGVTHRLITHAGRRRHPFRLKSLIGKHALKATQRRLYLDRIGRGDHNSRHSHIPLVSRQKDRKSTRLNSSHVKTSYAVFCLKKKNLNNIP